MKGTHLRPLGVRFDERMLAAKDADSSRRPPSRRMFLRSAAVTIGLPWLESMVRSRQARAATQPVRLIAWHTPNGYYARSWFPSTVGAAYELSPTLSPMANVKKKLLVLSGIQNNDASVVFGSHGLGVAGMLTCVLGTKPAVKVGISVDQVYAQSLKDATPIQSLQIGITNRMYADIGNPAIYNGCISWASPTQPLQPVIQPGLIFDQIFQGPDRSAFNADSVRRRAIASSVLDHVTEEAKSMQARLGVTDRRKLDEYLTGVRTVEAKIRSATAPLCSTMGRTKPANTGLDWATQSKISCDLMVMALQCDATRVISFMLGNGGSSSAQSFPWLNINTDHHALAHAQNAIALSAIDKWHVGQ
ncbi:MAG TPA: DUF1552 domain-containing protein, partial [Polyangia bacterium]